MENSGMEKMFKSQEVSGLKGFLETSDSVYESVAIEFFANAKVIAGTIVSLVGTRKMALTKDQFIEAFGLPSEGLTSFLNIPKDTVAEMRHQFSGSDEPFRAPNKKREMKIEFRLLHDVKVLTCKSVQTYIKKNLEIKPSGESSKQNEDTASNTKGGESQGAQPVKKAKTVNKKKMTTEEEPRQKKQKVSTQPVETRSKTDPADSSSQFDLDSCSSEDKKKQRVTKRMKRVESCDSKSNISLPTTHLVRRKRTQRPQTQQRSTGERDDPQHEEVSVGSRRAIARFNEEATRVGQPFCVDCCWQRFGCNAW
ncbi:hypothetical protein F511_37021 [Dorcoceras hygrometricum]|uniref:Uncharacterized protein n=1 Tax=Dorcoceras hygrometricum TaxID=472368 RepID=A0A2Z7BFS5_9LAMI|nr:hypothetical protein F511_37021 [Dorcoceras hygrometricum]